MAAALFTAALVSFAGLVASVFVGPTEADLARHATLAIFATLLTLLSHSMMMFYLIGKGRAVRDAVTDGGLSSTFVADIARARRPVFSVGMLAMALTMTTAIMGASVDTGVLPAGVHATVAYASLAATLATLRVEAMALAAIARIVADVNRLLHAHRQS